MKRKKIDSSAIRQRQLKNSTVQTFEERARENQRVVSQGAEATIYLNQNLILKKRNKKEYRIEELDKQIIKLRTRAEAKILEKAKQKISCPKILNVNEKTGEILMEFIEGKRISEHLNKISLKEQKNICKIIGENISKIHSLGIAHQDLTTSNMIYNKKQNKVYLIDFGLSFQNARYEDKAVDLHLLKQALEAKHWKNWEILWQTIKNNYYLENSQEATKVLQQLNAVEKRGRYKH